MDNGHLCVLINAGLLTPMEMNLKNYIVSMKKDGKGNKTIEARKLWNTILDSQIETGTLYMLYKDAIK